MKYIQKTILLLACFSLLLSISTVKKTYAKYKNDITGVTTMNIARWKILVNNQDITSSSSLTTGITPTLLETTHIKNGVIAPTSEGYFDIIIDSTNTDVSFSYNITLESDDSTSVTDLIIKGYKVNNDINNNNTPMNEIDVDGITGNVLLADNNSINTIRVYVEWNDDNTTETMDNSADTNASLSEEQAIVNVSLNLTQIA